MPNEKGRQDYLKAPIMLVGPHRSGTTWLSHAFERSPEVAYFGEPRHVWQWGHWFRSDDRLIADDATPQVRRHIREAFAQYVRKQGRERLCEKTPSNCLRLPFIREVYPEAKIVFIIRDGRSVFRSAREVMDGGISAERWAMRFKKRFQQCSITDLPAFVSRVPWMVNSLMGRPIRFWGPRPPGWREWLRRDSQEVVIAKQWAHTVRYALDDLEQMDPSIYYKIHYEDFVQHPVEVMSGILEFAGIRDPAPVLAYVQESADATRITKWRESLESELLERVRPHMKEVMERLGYEW